MWRLLDHPTPLHLWEGPGESAAPTVLFLHGAGERGTDGLSALRYGLPSLLTLPRREAMRVLVPQCPSGSRWTDHLDDVARGLDSLCIGAIALTGFSLGGQGVWAFAAQFPDRVNRLAPIAGRLPRGVEPMKLAASIPDVPIWVTHGARDDRVPVAESDAIVAALTAQGRRPTYTRYADLDHVRSCDAAYRDDAYRAWLAGRSAPL
jgi:predicted peptidase